MMNLITLKQKLSALALVDNEQAAITGWTDAWVAYMQDAMAGTVPIIGWALEAAPAQAMRAALQGMAAPGAGALALQAGIVAFWGAIVVTPFTYFSGATAITPPTGIADLASRLQGTFARNLGAPSQQVAMGRIAENFHRANQDGSATFPGPITFPIV